MEASQISEKEALGAIAHLICPALEKESFMPNIAEKWKQEGLEQGILQGIVQGMEKGMEKGITKSPAIFLKRGSLLS